jgi:hypothetical protein
VATGSEGATVNEGPTVPAVRGEGDDLRTRSDRLRERSRVLQHRSQLWRTWTARAAERVDRSDHAAEIQRLLQAETDLERAIAECKISLEDVRRELRWQDLGTPSVVH